MDNASSTQSILDTLRTVEFRLGLKGYNVDEVDEYLEKAAVEAEQVQERLRVANERLRHATERIAQLEVEVQRPSVEHPAVSQQAGPQAASGATGPAAQENAVTDDTLQRTLLLAQKFVEQTKRESEAEAAQLVNQADERARALLAQAEEHARQLTSEAEERLRNEVAKLEKARVHLAGDVEAMSRHLEEQRTKMRGSLVEALRWVDEQMPAPVRAKEERGAAGGTTGQAAVREPSTEGTGSPARAEPAGVGGAGGSEAQGGAGAGSPSSAGAGAATRPQVASSAPGGPGRQQTAVPSHPSAAAPAPDRTQAAVGAGVGVLNGGLFEGQDETKGLEGDRLGE